MNDMQDSVSSRKFNSGTAPFIVLLVIFTVLAIMVISPLANAFAWSAVLSFFTYPVYRFIHMKIFRGRWSYLASALNTALIIFLMMFPVLGLLGTAVTELGEVYQRLVEWLPSVSDKLDWLFSRYPDVFDLSNWNDLLSNLPGALMSFITSVSGALLGNTFQLGFQLSVTTMGIFFLTHDGGKILSFLRDILPLSPLERDVFFIRARQTLYAIFYGVIMIAGIHGVMGGIGWWFVGLPNSVVFGLLIFFLAMIPMLGAPLVYVPGAIYLWATGDARNAVILAAWCLVMVGVVDNVLGPIFYRAGTKAPILMVFAGILGGLARWGFLGLFVGPLVLSAAYFLILLYQTAVVPPEAETSAEGTGETPQP